MLALTVHFDLHPQHVAAFRETVMVQAARSLEREPGCLQFDVCFVPEDPTKVFLYEVYKDKAAYEAHIATEHFHEFVGLVADWVRDKQVATWDLNRV